MTHSPEVLKPERTVALPWLCVVGAAFIHLYWSAIQYMVSVWYHDANYSHGFIIPFVSAYLVWERRQQLAAAARKPSNWGLVLVGAGLFLFLLAHLSAENFTKLFSMLPVIAGTILFTAGADFLRTIMFPFGYLIFMIPLPYLLYDAVAFPLKLFVSWISVLVLQLLGIPVIRDGNIIGFSTTTLEVADACSGIRSIISLLALSAALAFFTQKGWLRKVVLVASAVPIAIVANSFRVILTGVLANRYGARVAQGFFHEFAGLAIFAVALVLLVGTSLALRKRARHE